MSENYARLAGKLQAHLEFALEDLERALGAIPKSKKDVRAKVATRVALIRSLLTEQDRKDKTAARAFDALGAAAQHLSLTGRPEAGR